MAGQTDLKNFKKTVTCDGRKYDDFSNFSQCQIWAEEDFWLTAEHYYQALKFPGEAGTKAREEIRTTSSPMECWQRGNRIGKNLLRSDWEEVKVEMMFTANLAKFSQSDALRALITGTRGPICCDGGLFWKTWNEVILERVREELRVDGERDSSALSLRVELMEGYRKAAASSDQREVDIVTQLASKRQLKPELENGSQVTVSGLAPGEDTVFNIDLLRPEVNGFPHWIGSGAWSGWHLFLGKKRGSFAWVMDEMFAADEKTGFAFLDLGEESGELPEGDQEWQMWSESTSRHVAVDLNVTVT